MKDHISVFITKEDFETKDYYDCLNCPLATALKREGYKLGYEGNLGAVGGKDVWMGEETYAILEWDEIAKNSEKPEGLMVNLLRI